MLQVLLCDVIVFVIMTIDEKIELMKKYLMLKFQEQDWHGVMDAAADLRELMVEKKHEKSNRS